MVERFRLLTMLAIGSTGTDEVCVKCLVLRLARYASLCGQFSMEGGFGRNTRDMRRQIVAVGVPFGGKAHAHAPPPQNAPPVFPWLVAMGLSEGLTKPDLSRD